MARTPFSSQFPLLPEGDDLISAQAIHYTTEYHRLAAMAAKRGLIEPDDPGLCPGALAPDAPVGAARRGLVAEVRALLPRLRQAEPTASGRLAKTLRAMEITLGRHRRGPLAPALAADLARALERAMLLLAGPRELLEEAATLVARLSDTAVLTARHKSFNGFCSDLAAESNYDDLRCVAQSLTRDGTLPAGDPRVGLSHASLERVHSDDITVYFRAVLETAGEVSLRLAPCGAKAFAPLRLSRIVNGIWETMEKGLLLSADQPTLDVLRALARAAEGLGMNLHLQGRVEDRDIVDRLLSLSVMLLGRSHPIAYQLRCAAAGLAPMGYEGDPMPERILMVARGMT